MNQNEYSIDLKEPLRGKILACGADMKGAYAMAGGGSVLVSCGYGDLSNADELGSYEKSITDAEERHSFTPEIVAHDMHPDYFSTAYAVARNDILIKIAVQHHHAHIVSCMADNDMCGPVIGVAFDGTGYGSDGGLWGGEFMIADAAGFVRAAHLYPVNVPGGDAAVLHPWRMAYSYIHRMNPETADIFFRGKVSGNELAVIRQALQKKINCPVTTSAGRLFDAVSTIIRFREIIEYEGQAAIELEKMCRDAPPGDPFRCNLIKMNGSPARWGDTMKLPNVETVYGADFIPVAESVMKCVGKGTPAEVTAARFHSTVAHAIKDICVKLSKETGLMIVALSGGVFQNRRLLGEVKILLSSAGLDVLIHKRVPCNDSGIPIGQVVIADAAYKKRTEGI